VSGLTAFYDANVLYPSELQNLLMNLALTGLFRAKWSAAVTENGLTRSCAVVPICRGQNWRTRMLMDLHAADALVTGYEELIDSLQLPEPCDRHVLAAAIRGRADVIGNPFFMGLLSRRFR